MRTRMMLLVTLCVALFGAAYEKDLAAAYVAFGACAILYLLHTIEFKLNKLLDHYGIVVSDHEAARD